MKRAAVALLLTAAAVGAGLACGELLYRSTAPRELIARTFGRGELVAVVNGVGIYEEDGEDLAQLITAANLRHESRDEQISDAEIQGEFELLLRQFSDPKLFESALEDSGLSAEALRVSVAEHLRARQWIEKQIAPALPVTDEASRKFYEAHPERFAQPARFRVSHLFLAAPATKPPEVVQAQADAIKSLAKRLSKGEDFAALVAEASEDEATNNLGGDLGFLASAPAGDADVLAWAETRMPADFLAEVQKLQPGKLSAPVRLPLGFHILQLTDSRPARQMEFVEARGEIALHLTNAKRAAAVDTLRQRLATAEFIRTPL